MTGSSDSWVDTNPFVNEATRQTVMLLVSKFLDREDRDTLSHYDRRLDFARLPGGWSATGGSLEGHLFLLLQDLEDSQGTYLIVARTNDSSGQTYAQVLRLDDGRYVVEHREGDAEHHYGTVVPDMRVAHGLLTG